MIRSVSVGQTILATDSNRELVVTGIISKEIRDTGSVGFDFLATHKDSIGNDNRGNALSSDRAFKYDSNNWTIV